ncbi:hypothetical protein J4727_18470 [Providencia rettgeri]|uniref:Uncharacterized protein n=1 Tax=Providencia rettgeri TaxID=587 RepID=A0A939NH42_PRORE|nr:hypothetical protein [Providencia rettgeri]
MVIGWNLNTYAQSTQESPGTSSHYITKPSADGRYGTIPGYMVWDARGEYHLKSLSDLTLSAGIKNLLIKLILHVLRITIMVSMWGSQELTMFKHP